MMCNQGIKPQLEQEQEKEKDLLEDQNTIEIKEYAGFDMIKENQINVSEEV